MNDEVIVSNIKKATSIYVLVFVQDKVAASVTNIQSKNKEIQSSLGQVIVPFSRSVKGCPNKLITSRVAKLRKYLL